MTGPPRRSRHDRTDLQGSLIGNSTRHSHSSSSSSRRTHRNSLCSPGVQASCRFRCSARCSRWRRWTAGSRSGRCGSNSSSSNNNNSTSNNSSASSLQCSSRRASPHARAASTLSCSTTAPSRRRPRRHPLQPKPLLLITLLDTAQRNLQQRRQHLGPLESALRRIPRDRPRSRRRHPRCCSSPRHRCSSRCRTPSSLPHHNSTKCRCSTTTLTSSSNCSSSSSNWCRCCRRPSRSPFSRGLPCRSRSRWRLCRTAVPLRPRARPATRERRPRQRPGAWPSQALAPHVAAACAHSRTRQMPTCQAQAWPDRTTWSAAAAATL